MGQIRLSAPPSIYGQRWVALEPEGLVWGSDDQDYEEYTAETGDGLVLDAALQERVRPLGVLTPEGRFICNREDPQEDEPEDPEASSHYTHNLLQSRLSNLSRGFQTFP